jgi:hypothetical protein
MKLLNIALLLILSLNAFAGTPVEEVASPDASSSKILSQIFKFSQTSPTTHKVLLVTKLTNAVFHLWYCYKHNREAANKGTKKLSILHANLHGIALRYIRQHLFAMYVEDKIYSKSQLSTENHYMRLVKNGALGLTHAYTLIMNAYATYKCAFNKRAEYYYGDLLGWILTFAQSTAHAGLQYKTIRALEDPKNHKMPTWLKTTYNATALASFGYNLQYLYNHPERILGVLTSIADLVTQTLFINQLVTAAQRHIAAQQSQA